MAHTTHTANAGHVTRAERRAFNQRSIFVTACRSVSIISGGFLLGSNLGWSPIVGGGLGIVTFLAIEVGVRRGER